MLHVHVHVCHNHKACTRSLHVLYIKLVKQNSASAIYVMALNKNYIRKHACFREIMLTIHVEKHKNMHVFMHFLHLVPLFTPPYIIMVKGHDNKKKLSTFLSLAHMRDVVVGGAHGGVPGGQLLGLQDPALRLLVAVALAGHGDGGGGTLTEVGHPTRHL